VTGKRKSSVTIYCFKPGKLTMVVSTFYGWRGLVHSMSHRVHRRKNGYGQPSFDDHDFRHAWIEKTMIKHVVESGWLDGRFKRPEKPKPTTADLVAGRKARTLASISRWQTKLRRAEAALKKLKRRASYYDRTAA